MYNVIGLFDTIPCYNEQMKSDNNIQKNAWLKKTCPRSLKARNLMNSLCAEVGTFHSSTGTEKPIHKLLNNLRKVSP